MQKKGVSEIVSYVLLISITFAISGMVYGWLVFYVTPGKETKCDEGVALTVRSFVYNCTTKAFNISFQNRGLFDIDGYTIRVSNQTGAEIGVYTLNKTGTSVNTSVVLNDYYANSSKIDDSRKILRGNITFLEVQPFQKQNGEDLIYCDTISKQKIICS